MSRANGRVRFQKDGLVLCFLYNGTSDICWTRLVDTPDEAWGAGSPHYYGSADPAARYRECVCEQHEPVEIATDYGNGFSWPGRACRTCRAITHGSNPDALVGDGSATEYQDLQTDGLPDWWADAVAQH